MRKQQFYFEASVFDAFFVNFRVFNKHLTKVSDN